MTDPKSVIVGSVKYQFWMADTYGFVRWRETDNHYYRPERWRDGRWWIEDSPYVLDAITGMGEDPYSCGSWAYDWTVEQAKAYAAEHGIDLFAENPDAPNPPQA